MQPRGGEDRPVSKPMHGGGILAAVGFLLYLDEIDCDARNVAVSFAFID